MHEMTKCRRDHCVISFLSLLLVVFFLFRVCEFGSGETRPDAKRLFDGVARLISGALWKQSRDLISSRREFLTVVWCVLRW